MDPEAGRSSPRSAARASSSSTRGADDRERPRDLHLGLEREVPQRMGQVGTKRGSLPRAISLAVRRTAPLITMTRHRARRPRRSPALEAQVDRDRGGLRDALEAAGEHDRRAEFTQRPCPAQGRTGAEAGRCQRHGHPQEHLARARTERPAGGQQILVDCNEGRLGLAQVERPATNVIAITTAAGVNGSWSPRASSSEPSIPVRPNAAKRPRPATAGGSTRGSSNTVERMAFPRKSCVAIQ